MTPYLQAVAGNSKVSVNLTCKGKVRDLQINSTSLFNLAYHHTYSHKHLYMYSDSQLSSGDLAEHTAPALKGIKASCNMSPLELEFRRRELRRCAPLAPPLLWDSF